MDDAWLQAAHEAYEWGHSQGVLTQPPSAVASLSSEDVRQPSPLLDGQPPAQFHHVAELGEAVDRLREWTEPGDVVLVKGSRSMRMEKLCDAFLAMEGRVS